MSWDLAPQEKKEEALLHLAAENRHIPQALSVTAIRSRGVDEEHLLTFYAEPLVMHRSIRSTNAHSKLLKPRAAT